MSRNFTTHETTRIIGLGRKIVRAFGFGFGVGPSGPALFWVWVSYDTRQNPNNCSGSPVPDPGKISLIFLSRFIQ